MLVDIVFVIIRGLFSRGPANDVGRRQNVDFATAGFSFHLEGGDIPRASGLVNQNGEQHVAVARGERASRDRSGRA